MSHRIFRDPVHAIGNSEDARTTNPDSTQASLVSLGKGQLQALQDIADGIDIDTTGLATSTKQDAAAVLVGAVTETAPATDTASSGLNGRLQRIAQRITSLIALVPASLGAKTAAASFAVTLATDDAAVTTLGAKTDAKSTATDTTSVSAMSVWKQISASVQLLVFGAGTAAAAQRVTHASDDPVTTSVQIMDDWDQTDACKVALLMNTRSANFTRPTDTTAYASGDLIANNTTAGSVTPMSWAAARATGLPFYVRRVRFSKTTTTTTNAQFRLHLYTASPTVANGDNAAYSTPIAGYLGAFEIDASQGLACSDGVVVSGVPRVGGEITVNPSGTDTIYGLLEARAAYAPGNAEVFTCVLEIFQG